MAILSMLIEIRIGVHFHSTELARIQLLSRMGRCPVFLQVDAPLELFAANLALERLSSMDVASVVDHGLHVGVRFVTHVAFGFLRLVYLDHVSPKPVLPADPHVANFTSSSILSSQLLVNHTVRIHCSSRLEFLTTYIADELSLLCTVHDTHVTLQVVHIRQIFLTDWTIYPVMQFEVRFQRILFHE